MSATTPRVVAEDLQARIRRENAVDTDIVCDQAREALVQSFGGQPDDGHRHGHQAHAGLLRALECDSALMRDLLHIRNAFTRELEKNGSLGRARRVLLRHRVDAMLERHGDDAAVVALLSDLLETHRAWG